MIVKILGLALVAYICKAQSQNCGCGGTGPILSGPLSTPSLESGVELCNGPLSGPFNLPGSIPFSTPKLPNNLSGPVTLPAPLQPGRLGPISGPVIAESFAKPTYLPSTLQPLPPSVVTPVAAKSFASPVNVIATTVIDNSVANSLANTLQLLVVSNLIQSTLNSGASSLLDEDIFETVSTTPVFASTVDVVSPISEIGNYGSSMFKATPNFYGGITEVVSPVNVEPFRPIYGGIPELVSPFSPGIGGSPANPNFYGGVTEVVSPVNVEPFMPIYGGIPELVSPFSPNIGPFGGSPANPNFYGGITEVVSPVNVEPFRPIYGGIPELVSSLSPNIGPFGGSPTNLYEDLPEFNTLPGSQFNTLYGYTDMPPLPTVLPMQVSEVIAPIAPLSLTPNFYNCVTEMVNPVTLYTPVAAEILIPSSIPAQLVCTLSYIPSSLPVVSINVETLAFDEFGLNNVFGNSYAF